MRSVERELPACINAQQDDALQINPRPRAREGRLLEPRQRVDREQDVSAAAGPSAAVIVDGTVLELNDAKARALQLERYRAEPSGLHRRILPPKSAVDQHDHWARRAGDPRHVKPHELTLAACEAAIAVAVRPERSRARAVRRGGIRGEAVQTRLLARGEESTHDGWEAS